MTSPKQLPFCTTLSCSLSWLWWQPVKPKAAQQALAALPCWTVLPSLLSWCVCYCLERAVGSEQHLNKTCQTVISSTICHPSAASARVPECLGYKLKCVELHIAGANVGSSRLLGLMGWLKDKISPSQFCCSFTYPVTVKWLAKTVWPSIISRVGLAPLMPFNLQNNSKDPSILLQMLSVSFVPTEWALLQLLMTSCVFAAQKK